MIGSVLRMRYELTGLLAEGPVFASYSALDRVHRRDVCVRIVQPPFDREAGFLDRLALAVKKYKTVQHAGIETITEFDQDEDQAFVISELTRGPTLADRLRKLAPFSVPVSVGTAISIAYAVDAIHRAALVHGDLRPQNMVVLADGEVHLQMAGIWESYSGSITAGAMVLPLMAPYLAPEISKGSMPSMASDIYAMGVILFELVCGRQPFHADTPMGYAIEHATALTPSAKSTNPSVPVVLDEIIKKALSKDPQDRYRKAGDMLIDLRMLQDALRFGRSLSWPLRSDGAPLKSKPLQPVAPKMSAIRPEEIDGSPRQARPQRDVPVWMIVTAFSLVAVVCSLIGVWMIFNLNKPKLVTVPNIRGLSATEARSMLKDLKLDLRVTSTRADERSDADKILDVSPPPGDRVREGGRVGVVVSAGSRFVEVPDLKGATLDKAKTVLEGLGLFLDSSVDKATDPIVGSGIVVRQTPEVRTRVERQTAVHVTVSLGPETDLAAGTTQTFIYSLDLRIVDTTKPTAVRVTISDELGARSIYDSIRNNGDSVHIDAKSYGRLAEFVIFYDNVEVKRFTKQAAEGTPNP